MEDKNKKDCPFNKEECSANCALYISPEDLNETVKNKLASVGIIDRKTGLCSIKNIALGISRYMFEKTFSGYR